MTRVTAIWGTFITIPVERRLSDDFTHPIWNILEKVERWGAIVVTYSNTNSLNSLEQVLLSGLEQERDRLKALSPEERLGTNADASPEEVQQAYEIVAVNYLARNYTKHDPRVIECAQVVLELLEEAKANLLGEEEADEPKLSSELAEMAFAATQITDDIPPPLSRLEDAVFKRADSQAAAVLPPPSSVPPPHFSHPVTPSYGYPSQDIPRPPQGLTPPQGMTPPYTSSSVPYPNPNPVPPGNYPNAPSWDLPPPRTGNPLYPNANMPPSPIPPAYGQPPRTGDLPPHPNQQEARLRELSHRLYSAESRMRGMERTHQERITLIESQLAAAEYRAQEAEHRAIQLEVALNEAQRLGSSITARPVSPAR